MKKFELENLKKKERLTYAHLKDERKVKKGRIIIKLLI